MEMFALAFGIGKAVAGLWGSSRQKKAEKAQAELSYRSNLEDIRRREFDQMQTKGKAKAFSENAGVLHSGGSTAQQFLDTMASEFDKEISFMRQYAEQAKSLGMKQAQLNAQMGAFNAVAGGFETYSIMRG